MTTTPEGDPQPTASPAPYVSPLPPQGFAPPQLITDQKNNGLVTALAWVAAVCTLLYMLPWAVAATRGKSNATAVALINLLLGWTLIGWIVALVMACGAHQVAGYRHS